MRAFLACRELSNIESSRGRQQFRSTETPNADDDVHTPVAAAKKDAHLLQSHLEKILRYLDTTILETPETAPGFL